MKSRMTALALLICFMLTLVSVAPAAASSDEAQIKTLVSRFMTLLAKGDFKTAVTMKVRKLSIPPQDSIKYRMITRLAGAYKGIENILIKGDRAKAYFRLDPKVVQEVVRQVYQYQLDQAKKISDPKRRAAMVERLEKNKDRIIASRAKRMIRSRIRLQKKAGKWMIY